MILATAQLVIGMVILYGSAEVLIRGAVSLAKAFRVSPLVIGMTIIAIGTSAPELVVTVDAALVGAPGLAIGNVIGSNIANVLLILGACCVLAPIADPKHVHRRDGIMLVAGTLVFVVLCAQGALGRFSGAVLLVLLAGFLVSSYRREAADDGTAGENVLEVEAFQPLPWPTPAVAGVVLAGLGGVVLGADLLVKGGIAVARAHDISEEIIGLTVIALGTSLPELATSVVAAMRGQSDMAVGNVVGSNLFNILGVAGVAAMVAPPIPMAARLLTVDIGVMVGATALVVPILAGRWRPGRRSGVALLVLYVAYIAYNGVDAGIFGAG